MPAKWFNGEVISIHDVAPDTKQFFLKVPDDEKFDFIPGQFVTMDLPVSDKRLHRWKSYSIANAPDNNNILEFCIVRMPEGAATTYLFNEIKPGNAIKFKGPDGGFVIPQNLDNELVMMCTGTGIAPFRSMIQHIHKKQIPYHKIHLIFGTRYENGILYREEMEKLSRESEVFSYSVALSRESAIGFHHGYIHPIYLNEYEVPNSETQFYICGWTPMIDEAVANLITKLGVNRSQIHYELYG